jgi:hypothetical protein
MSPLAHTLLGAAVIVAALSGACFLIAAFAVGVRALRQYDGDA